MESEARETDAINSDSIRPDSLFEILLKLPVKSVARFVNVSKFFATIIRSREFIRSFSLRSSKQKQRLLLAFSGIDKEKGGENWFFFSSSLEEPSPVFLSRTAYDVPDLRNNRPDYVHGLISFVYGQEQIISNPSTGKSITLPLVKSRRSILERFFGFDPVDVNYKVLCVTEPMFGTGMGVAPSECQVLTLGSSQQNPWRKIECSIPHRPRPEGVCVNGVLYYYAHMCTKKMEPCLMRFDVRSENFQCLTRLPVEVQICLKQSRLINYEGNVASFRTSFNSSELWVLEDFTKQQWLKVSLSVSPWYNRPLDLRGKAQTGEIVYASYHLDDFYFVLDDDPNINGLKIVEVEVKSEYEFGRFIGVVSFLDYVESVMLS